jgi:DNA (cytosine-5)-methyltransferase 1
MVRFIEIVRPRFAVIENVPGVAHSSDRVVPQALAALRAAGYRIDVGLVNAAEVGAAQSRRRHVLIAARRDTGTTPSLARMRAEFGAPQRPVLWAIDDVGVEEHLGTFGTPARHMPVNRERIDYLFKHNLHDLPDSERPDCHRLKPHSYRSVYGRMHADRPAPTITAGFGSCGQGRFVHPTEPRTLTPHEAARIQGFPDFFSFAGADLRGDLQRMIGNAVPSQLAFSAVAELIR